MEVQLSHHLSQLDGTGHNSEDSYEVLVMSMVSDTNDLPLVKSVLVDG